MEISSEITRFLRSAGVDSKWVDFGVGGHWKISSRIVGVKMGVARARVGDLWRGIVACD